MGQSCSVGLAVDSCEICVSGLKLSYTFILNALAHLCGGVILIIFS